MSILDRFSFLDKYRYKSVEPKGTPLGRKCIRKNGKYVLREDNGKVITEADWISDPVCDSRLTRNDIGFAGIVRQTEDNQIKHSTLNIDEVPGVLSENLGDNLMKITFLAVEPNDYNIIMFDNKNNISPTYRSISNENKNGLRIAIQDDKYCITKQNGEPILDLQEISSKDSNGVSIGRVSYGNLIFLPKNFDENFIRCSTIEHLTDRTYKLTLDNDKIKVLNSDGKETIPGTFDSVEILPNTNIVINKSAIYNSLGKKFKRPSSETLKYYSTRLGILEYRDKDENVEKLFSSASSSHGRVVDPNVAQIYNSLINGKKPSRTRIQRVISENGDQAGKQFSEGKKAFVDTLLELKTGDAQQDAFIDEAIASLDIARIFKRKITGCKSANKKFDKKTDTVIEEFKKVEAETTGKLDVLESKINKNNNNIDVYAKIAEQVEKGE